MNLYEIFIILIVHFIADFIVQTDAQAKGKSTSIMMLLSHTFVYTCVWIPIILFYWLFYNFNFNLFWFLPITFIAHTITDYFTSKINKKLWEQKKSHEFFISVGFDQLLHFFQLFLTYYLLKFI